MCEVDIFSLLKSINDDDVCNLIEKLTAACFHQQEIYFGCKDGYLYKIENQTIEDENENSFVTSILERVLILENQSINQIEMCSLLNILCVLVNECIIFVVENPLVIKPVNIRLKNVVTFAIKEGLINTEGEYITEICIGTSTRKIQLYNMTSDRISFIMEISLTDIPYELSFNNEIVCVATKSGCYSIINLSNQQKTELFKLTSGTNVKPKITELLNQSGFLLLGPDGLGIFADENGASQTPPIQWSSTIRDFVAIRQDNSNYVIGVDHEFITVHNLSNQNQVQTIHFPNTTSCRLVPMTNHASSNQCSCLLISYHQGNWYLSQLVPCTLAQQARQLLKKHQIDSAVHLAQRIIKNTRSNIEKKKAQNIFNIAGFERFIDSKFKESKQLFEKGNIDLREVIICYPGILPKSYRFDAKVATPESGYRLEWDKIKNQAIIKQYKQFLLELLLENRESKSTRYFSQVLETALVKLYVELEPQKLYLNLTMMLSDVDYEDLVDYLKTNGYYHACGLVMRFYDQIGPAVDVWAGLLKGDFSDPQFPGFEFFKEILYNIEDPKIIQKNLSWLLNYDEESGSNVLIQFIEKYNKESDIIGSLINQSKVSTNQIQESTNKQDIWCIIEQYPNVKFEVLSVLSINKMLNNHKLVDSLGSMFIQKLKDYLLKKNKEQFQIIRNRFVEFLFAGSQFNCSSLLLEIRQFNSNCLDLDQKLIQEEAIVLGHLGRHTEALSLLVQSLGSNEKQIARRYCTKFSTNIDNLFLQLLQLYLDKCSDGSDNEYKEASLELLQNHSSQIEMKNVISVIPTTWPLDHLESYLRAALSRSRHNQLSACMNQALSQIQLVQSQLRTHQVSDKTRLLLDNKSKHNNCSNCGRAFFKEDCILRTLGSNQIKLFHKQCYDSIVVPSPLF